MLRMRTAKGVLAEIKAMDPNTEVRLYFIQKLIREERVPVVYAGNKKLVDADAVIKLLSGGLERQPEPDPPGGIRKVAI